MCAPFAAASVSRTLVCAASSRSTSRRTTDAFERHCDSRCAGSAPLRRMSSEAACAIATASRAARLSSASDAGSRWYAPPWPRRSAPPWPAQSWCRCGSGGPSPGADVAGWRPHPSAGSARAGQCAAAEPPAATSGGVALALALRLRERSPRGAPKSAGAPLADGRAGAGEAAGRAGNGCCTGAGGGDAGAAGCEGRMGSGAEAEPCAPRCCSEFAERRSRYVIPEVRASGGNGGHACMYADVASSSRSLRISAFECGLPVGRQECFVWARRAAAGGW